MSTTPQPATRPALYAVPWSIEPAGHNLVNIVDARKHPMACMVDREPAQLMVLAPELLASLIEFVDCNDGEHTLEMYHRARAVIAKATGRPST